MWSVEASLEMVCRGRGVVLGPCRGRLLLVIGCVIGSGVQ